MFVHHTSDILRNPNFAFQCKCLFPYPALSLTQIVLVFCLNSVPKGRMQVKVSFINIIFQSHII